MKVVHNFFLIWYYVSYKEYINNFLINELKLNDFERSIRYANRDILKERTIRIRFKISTELFKKLENKTKEVGRRSISNLMEFLIIRELEQRKDDKWKE